MLRFVLEHLQILLVACGMLASQLLLKHGMSASGSLSLSLGGFVSLIRQILTSPILVVGYGLGGVTTLVWLVILSLEMK